MKSFAYAYNRVATISWGVLAAYILVWQAQGVVHSAVRGFRMHSTTLGLENDVLAQEVNCTPPVYDPTHLDLWQSTKDLSVVQAANDNNRQFLPKNTVIHSLSDDDMTQRMEDLSAKLEQCAGVSGVFQAFKDLRPWAFRSDLYRAAQLYWTGGLWMDDKIWLMQDFSTFVNVAEDSIVLPKESYFKKFNLPSDERAVANALMWSVPRQEYWVHSIRLIVDNVLNRAYHDNPLDITGPITHYRALTEYMKGSGTAPRRDLELVHDDDACESLSGQLENHNCKTHFALSTSLETMVAFSDEHDHHAGKDPALHYDTLWHSRQVYCDVVMNNSADPCQSTSSIRMQNAIDSHIELDNSGSSGGTDTINVAGFDASISSATSPLTFVKLHEYSVENNGLARHIDCTPPVYDPTHLDLWQSTKDPSVVQAANDNNRQFLPKNTVIHSLSDDDMTQRMEDLSAKLEQCAGVSGVFQAFKDLRPWAFRSDLYRAAQLYWTGGLWMDHKIWLTKDFSTFVDVSKDTILLPSDIAHWKVPGGGRVVHNGILWSIPRHPILLRVIQRIIQNVQDRFYGEDALAVTGPRAYYSSFIEHLSSDNGGAGVRRDLELFVDTYNYGNVWFTQMFNLLAQKSVGTGMFSCAASRPPGFQTHSCVSYFALSGDPLTMVALRDEDQHHVEGPTSLNYAKLWAARQVYCDVAIENSTDPCKSPHRMQSAIDSHIELGTTRSSGSTDASNVAGFDTSISSKTSPLTFVERHEYSPDFYSQCDSKYGVGFVTQQKYNDRQEWVTVCNKTDGGVSELRCFVGNEDDFSEGDQRFHYFCSGSNLALRKTDQVENRTNVELLGDCDWVGLSVDLWSRFRHQRFPPYKQVSASFFQSNISCAERTTSSDPFLFIAELDDGWNPYEGFPQHVSSFVTLILQNASSSSGVFIANPSSAQLFPLWQDTFGPVRRPDSLPTGPSAFCVEHFALPFGSNAVPFAASQRGLLDHPHNFRDDDQASRDCPGSPVMKGYGDWFVSKFVQSPPGISAEIFRIVYTSRNVQNVEVWALNGKDGISRRSMQNEADFVVAVTHFARSQGSGVAFETVHMESLSMQEQVSKVSSASLLIAPHGASLTWLILMQDRQCSTVIEFEAVHGISKTISRLLRLLPSVVVSFVEIVVSRFAPILNHYQKLGRWVDIQHVFQPSGMLWESPSFSADIHSVMEKIRIAHDKWRRCHSDDHAQVVSTPVF